MIILQIGGCRELLPCENLRLTAPAETLYRFYNAALFGTLFTGLVAIGYRFIGQEDYLANGHIN